MALAPRTRLALLLLTSLLAWPSAAIAQISGGSLLNLPGRINRNNVAYDNVNQVYLVITDRPPVRGRFLNKNGTPIGGEFQISLEPGDPYLGWVNIAFGGPSNDPTYLVTYVIADNVQNPKFARFVRFNGGAPTVSGAIHIADTTTEWFASEKAQTIWNGQRFVIGSRAKPPGWSFATPQLNLLDMAGNLTPPLFLGDNTDLQGAPAVSCAPSGVCLVIGFMAGIPTGYSGGTYARRFDYTSMTPLGSLFFLAAGSPNEDQGVVFQTHTGLFLAQWYRGGGAGYIDTRLIATDGWMSPLDLGRGIGPGSGANAFAYNATTRTSLLMTKRTDQALVLMELGDDGYPVNQGNTVVMTPWDGSTPDYWPSLAANHADAQWLTTAQLSAGTVGRIIQGSSGTNLVQNGTFSGGMTGWSTFAQPTPGDLVTSVSNGVLSFYRTPQPPGTPQQGVVLQPLGVGLPDESPLTAMFDIGNSSTVRKRVIVILHDLDFSDLQVCTFWLAPGAPLRTYRMHTHANTVWEDATIAFYAATAGSDGGAFLLDNVRVYATASAALDRTECVDPTTPAPQSFPDSNNLLTNGDFAAGLAPWGTFGQITHQIAGGVFEFVRPAGTPNGAVLQTTGLGLPTRTKLTMTLRLGNSSAVRRRVIVLIHDNDFSDLAACSFWLAPGQSLATHTMKTYTTKAWTNMTVAVYGGTVSTAPWVRLDDVDLKVTVSPPLVGTECIEPFSGSGEPNLGAVPGSETGRLLPAAPRATHEVAWRAEATETGAQAFVWSSPIDLRDATASLLRFDSRLADGASEAFVEVTSDGIHWTRVAGIPPSDEWTGVAVDLSAFAGDIIYVRFVYAGVAPIGGEPLESWAIRDIVFETRAHAVSRTGLPRR